MLSASDALASAAFRPTPSDNSPAPATAPTSTADSPAAAPRTPSTSTPGSPSSPPNHLKRPLALPADETPPTLPSDEAAATRRRRKKTRIFEVPSAPRRVSTGALGVTGRGTKLTAIPNVANAIDKCTAKDPQIELLHRVLFNSAGVAMRRKATIKSFSGFMFRSEKERSRVRDKILRTHLNLVRKVVYLLDLDMGDTKESTADAIIAFLELPRIIEGKGNRAERERLQKAERRRAEKARAKKKREDELKRQRQALAELSDQDEDGDKDLEREAIPWVEMARLAAERREREGEEHRLEDDEVLGTDESSGEDDLNESSPPQKPEPEREVPQVDEEKRRRDEERRRQAEEILLVDDDSSSDA